jgi:glycosyltransferase involved in cell wall biosynthesis
MAGDGELIEECRKRVQLENLPVKILGWQTNIELVLSASDIVILTSDNEGTPLSLIQAGMAGKPVVSTNVGSVEDIVVTNVTGFVTSLEVTEIADSLERLVTNPELRAEMGRAAKKYTIDRFSERRLVLDHQNLYKKLISDRANS